MPDTRTAVFLVGLICFGQALALEIDKLDVTKEGGIYHLEMTFHVAAAAEEVIAVLTDYQNPDRLYPDVRDREVISRKNGITRVRTELRGCVFFFCRDLEMIQDVTSVSGIVQADIVPDDSDFRSGTLRWTIVKMNDQSSHVTFEANMEPDVFIPPLIGKMLIRRMLEREVLAIATNLENEAAN